MLSEIQCIKAISCMPLLLFHPCLWLISETHDVLHFSYTNPFLKMGEHAGLPMPEHGFVLHKGAFQDALCLCYGW